MSGTVPLAAVSLASLTGVVSGVAASRFASDAGSARSVADVAVAGGVTSGAADAVAATAAVSPVPVAAPVAALALVAAKGFSAEYSSTTNDWVVRHWK